MKRLAAISLWAIFILMTAWLVRSVTTDEEVNISLSVKKDSLMSATKGCHNQSGYGQAVLFDNKGRHFSIPCSVLIERESGK